MSHIKTIIRNATRISNERLNIITFPTHERYQSGLANTNATFYLWQGQGIKPWNNFYAKLPDNHILLNPKYKNQVPDHITPDLVLSQNKLAHYKISKEIAQYWSIPLVCLEHTLPMPTWSEAQVKSISGMRGNVNVFISDYSRKQWYGQPNDIIIHHGVDTNKFSPQKIKKEKYVLSVVNDWINRDEPCGFKFWQQVTNHPKAVLPVFVVGDTPRLSTGAKDIEELIKAYNMSSVFLNTSQYSPIPSVVLEAMSCGLPVVSTNNCMLPEVIKHGYNGFLSNNPLELRAFCKKLLDDDELRTTMGNNARETIINNFKLDSFTNNWEKLFRSIL